MKFLSTVSILSLLGTSLADLATIENVLTTVSQQVDALDTTVKAYSGGDPGALTSASDKLLATIKSGTSTVSGTSSLTENDALQVASFVTGLNSSVATVVNDLISKKTQLVAANAGGTVFQELTDQKAASTALANAITSKVPTDLQTLAGQLSAGIADSLQRGIDAFQGTGGSTSTSGGSAAPTSSASATSGSGSAPVSSPTGSSSKASSGTSAPTGTSGSSVSTASGAASSTPAVFTGAASAKQVGSSGLALVAAYAVLLM